MVNARAHKLLVVLTFLVCMMAPCAFAAGEGRILGTVTDASGAPVAGAKVLLTREGTESKQEKVTNQKGTFSLLVLDASVSYRIHIEKENFLPLDEPVKPVPGDTIRVSFTLKAPAPR